MLEEPVCVVYVWKRKKKTEILEYQIVTCPNISIGISLKNPKSIRF